MIRDSFYNEMEKIAAGKFLSPVVGALIGGGIGAAYTGLALSAKYKTIKKRYPNKKKRIWTQIVPSMAVSAAFGAHAGYRLQQLKRSLGTRGQYYRRRRPGGFYAGPVTSYKPSKVIFETLKINPATVTKKDQIKHAYRILSRKYHPDMHATDKAMWTEKFKQLNTAYMTATASGWFEKLAASLGYAFYDEMEKIAKSNPIIGKAIKSIFKRLPGHARPGKELYHHTTLENAKKILRERVLKGSTYGPGHPNMGPLKPSVKNVSFWTTNPSPGAAGSSSNVTFAINRNVAKKLGVKSEIDLQFKHPITKKHVNDILASPILSEENKIRMIAGKLNFHDPSSPEFRIPGSIKTSYIRRMKTI